MTPEPGEELVYLLPGFSIQSGIKVGEIFEEEEEVIEVTDEEGDSAAAPPAVVEDFPSPILFQSSIPGNKSEIALCLRIRAHYQRPETILVSAYVQNKTVLVIGTYVRTLTTTNSFACFQTLLLREVDDPQIVNNILLLVVVSV